MIIVELTAEFTELGFELWLLGNYGLIEALDLCEFIRELFLTFLFLPMEMITEVFLLDQ